MDSSPRKLSTVILNWQRLLLFLWLSISSIVYENSAHAAATDGVAASLATEEYLRKNPVSNDQPEESDLSSLSALADTPPDDDNQERQLLLKTKPSWLQEDFPNPETEADRCFSISSRRICDPDRVLTRQELKQVEEYLETKKYATNLCRTTDESYYPEESIHAKQDSDGKVEIQMAVALVGKVGF